MNTRRTEPSNKRRRLPRACDNCKHKKVKCNSDEMPGKRCSNCIAYNVQCKHVEALNSFGTARGYVQKLESRVEKLEALFKKILPDVDFEHEITIEEEHVLPDPQRSQFDDPVSQINRQVNHVLAIPPGNRFFGKSSGLHLVPMVIEARDRYLGERYSSTMQIKKREEFWNFLPWSAFPLHTPIEYEYPPDDLMISLVDLYFRHQNECLPLLHRPTFEKEIEKLAHLYDRQFGATLLLVCAHGSRYSHDERVYVEGNGEAGWKWLYQAISTGTRNGFEGQDLISLYELQVHALSASYLQAVGRWETVWTQLGYAFRRAQDMGAHIRRSCPPNSQDELWKRAFWVLYSLDVSLACRYGRPVSMRYEDIDVDYPIDCDDEFWDHEDPEQNFVQPADKPSKLSYFICLLKLLEIAAYVKRFVYSSRKSMIFSGYRRPSEQEILSSFDAAFEQWSQETPSHLKWNPDETNYTFLIQSGFLHMVLNYIRILAHRPYIVSLLEDPTNLTQSKSTTTCTQAAYACLEVVAELKKVGYIKILPSVSIVGAVTLTLLLIIYGRRSKPSDMDMKHVHTALEMLKSMEGSIPPAGAFWDILSHLTSEPYQNNMREQEPPTLSQDTHISGTPLNPEISSEVLDFYSFPTTHEEGDSFNSAFTPSTSQSVFDGSAIQFPGLPSIDYLATQPFLPGNWPHGSLDMIPENFLDLHRDSDVRRTMG